MDPDITRAGALALGSPLIVPIVQAIKAAGLPDRFAPIVAVVLGLVLAFAVALGVPGPDQPYVLTVLLGLASGLSAAGLYSGVRAVAQR